MATLTTEQRDLAEAVTDLMAKRSPPEARCDG